MSIYAYSTISQALSGLCLGGEHSFYLYRPKKTPGADPPGQVSLANYLFSWGTDEQGCRFSSHQFGLLYLIKSGQGKRGTQF